MIFRQSWPPPRPFHFPLKIKKKTLWNTTMRGTQKEKEKKGNGCRQCVHITWNRCFPPSKHNKGVPFWHCEVVNKRTFNAEGLSSSAEGMADLSRQQEKCGCEGEQEWAREKEPTGLFCTCPRMLPSPSLHQLFWPPRPPGTHQTWAETTPPTQVPKP